MLEREVGLAVLAALIEHGREAGVRQRDQAAQAFAQRVVVGQRGRQAMDRDRAPGQPVARDHGALAAGVAAQLVAPGEQRPQGLDRAHQLELAALASQPREHVEQLAHRGEARVGLDRQSAPQHPQQPRGYRAILGRTPQLAAHHPRRDRCSAGATEGPLAEQALPQRDAEGELIGAVIDREPAPLLGGHVRRRAHDRAGHGQTLDHVGGRALGRARQRRASGCTRRGRLRRQLALDVDAPRESEVEHAHATVVADQHVVGLEVAVHQPDGVGGREAWPASQKRSSTPRQVRGRC
ncbi:MAG: hypothetical protein U0168_28520 [Nannocystaceae bacterium]